MAGHERAASRALKVARLLCLALLAAGAVYGWDNFANYYFVAPGLVLLATLIALVMYLPSLWLIRRLDWRKLPAREYLVTFLFVAFFATISSRWTQDLIDAGVRYWQAVAPSGEFCKVSPLVVLLLFAPGAVRTMRDGIALGGIGGLSCAANEFATAFALENFPARGWAALFTDIPARWALGTEMHIVWSATAGGAIGYAVGARGRVRRVLVPLAVIAVVMITHGLQDWMGTYIAPLSLAVLNGPLAALGLASDSATPGPLLLVALLVYAATANTLLINVVV